MGGNNIMHSAIHATIFAILLVAPIVTSQDGSQIPSDRSQINQWFQQNVKSYSSRKGTLDPALATAEATPRVIRVRKDGSGDFNNIAAAIKSIPSGNTKRVIVSIGGGVYKEKIKIDRSQAFVTLYGSPSSMPTLTYSGTAAQYGTVDSASVIVEGDYFVAANLIIANSSPRPTVKTKGGQALAIRVSGDKASFYNCKFNGFQDTVCDYKGRHFFKDCYIEGSVDFIFGDGKSIYLNTEIKVLGDNGMSFITAHGGKSASENNGFSFVHCKITGTGNGTYLGRAWMPYPRVVFVYTSMSKVIKPIGWSDNFHPDCDKTVFFGEYQCSGEGSNFSGRAKFAKKLINDQVKPFITLGYIEASKWLLPAPKI